ncbi:Zinc finger, RING-type [Sesbania bispinosa]|nr:Zinc finger, RING-type [Sesbania bispinosa]
MEYPSSGVWTPLGSQLPLIPGNCLEIRFAIWSHTNTVLFLTDPHTFKCIETEGIFQEFRDFIISSLSSPHFGFLSVQQATDVAMSAIQQGFQLDHNLANANYESLPQSQEYLSLLLGVRLPEPTYTHIRMVPASKEAIKMSLKKVKVTEENQCCAICMEEFQIGADGNNRADEGYSMPCSHVFHPTCILKWLNKSNTCPLCRYPLPTVNEEMNDKLTCWTFISSIIRAIFSFL